MRAVPAINGLDMAFGNVAHLPPMKDIPEEFNRHGNKWGNIVSRWFFGGLPKGTEFIPKPGVDGPAALKAVAAILRSFEPKHEHKEAGCAYLLSEWFEDVKIPDEPSTLSADGSTIQNSEKK